FIEPFFLRGGLRRRAVGALGALRAVDAAILEPAQLLLEPVGGELDRRAGLVVGLGRDELRAVHADRDLGLVQRAHVAHDDVDAVDVVGVLVEFLEPLLGELAHARGNLALTGSDVDLHGYLLRSRCGGAIRRVRSVPQATRRRNRAGRMFNCSRYLATVRRAMWSPFSCNSSAMRWSDRGSFLSSSSMSVLMMSLAVRADTSS